MTNQQLAYFLAAAAYGSFSAAADALHLAQPSLSEQVRRLEDELGVELFARTTRGLTLTEAGRTLRPEAEAALAAVDRAPQSVLDVRELLAGTVTMGILARPPSESAARVVQRFRAEHPGVRLRLVGQNSVEVADAVRNGDAEAGLGALPVDDAGPAAPPTRARPSPSARSPATRWSTSRATPAGPGAGSRSRGWPRRRSCSTTPAT